MMGRWGRLTAEAQVVEQRARIEQLDRENDVKDEALRAVMVGVHVVAVALGLLDDDVLSVGEEWSDLFRARIETLTEALEIAKGALPERDRVLDRYWRQRALTAEQDLRDLLYYVEQIRDAWPAGEGRHIAADCIIERYEERRIRNPDPASEGMDE
jgi:hypothetical protein